MWRSASCQVVGAASLENVSEYVTTAKIGNASPIDMFYVTLQDLLRICTPESLDEHRPLGPLVVVGLVSATESYFRDLFARILRLCPVSQSKSADQTIHLGSMIWHRTGYVERGAFEHLSFAGAENVIKTSQKFLDYKIQPKGTVSGALTEFDKVCEIRHGIVHSSSILAGKNAVKLNLSSTNKSLSITVDYEKVQECALICTTLACTFNAEVYVEMCQRWALAWPNMQTISTKEHQVLFRKLWSIFRSKTDQHRRLVPRKSHMTQCMTDVKAEFC